jgi:hypothetical protein
VSKQYLAKNMRGTNTPAYFVFEEKKNSFKNIDAGCQNFSNLLYEKMPERERARNPY